jgi:leucyl-tRNA synthetase
VAEELWDKLHGRSLGSIAHADWPEYDEAMLSDDTVEIPVQIMGKVRSKVTVPAGADNATMEKAALADERIAGLLEGKTVRKVIVVPGRLVNIVAG